jgi:hypothetical protein
MKVALIDIQEYDKFVEILQSDVIPIRIESYDTYASLKEKIMEVGSITHIVIAQHYKPLLSIGSEMVLFNEPTTWRDLKKFLIDMKSVGVEYIDFLACMLYEVPGVKEMFASLESETGINLRASTDDTGNVAEGGNWLLESDMADISTLYFNEQLDTFKELFRVAYYSGDSIYPTTYASTSGQFAIIDASSNVRYVQNVSTSNKLVTSTGTIIANVTKVYANTSAFAAITTEGYVYIWGSSGNGGNGQNYGSLLRLDDATSGTPLTNIVSIEKTMNAFAAIDSTNNVYIWGKSLYGGNGQNYASLLRIDNATSGTPVSGKTLVAGWDFFAVISTANQVYSWGSLTLNYGGAGNNANYASLLRLTNEITGTPLGNIVKLYTTRYAAMAIDANGNMYIWGYNYSTPGTKYAKRIVNSQGQSITTADKIYMCYSAFMVLTTDKTAYYVDSGVSSTGTTETALLMKIGSSSGQTLTNIASIVDNECGFAFKTSDNTIYLANFFNTQGGPPTLTAGYCLPLRIDSDSGTIMSYGNQMLGSYATFCLLDLNKNVYMWGWSSGGGNQKNYCTIVRIDSAQGTVLSNVKTCYGGDSLFIAITEEGHVYYIGSGCIATRLRLNLSNGPYLTNITSAYSSSVYMLIDSNNNTYYYSPGNAQATSQSFSSVNLINTVTATPNNATPSVELGATINLQVNVVGGSQPYAYKWYKSNVLLPNEKNSTYVAESNSGQYSTDTQITYKCVVEDNNGYTAETSFNVTFKAYMIVYTKYVGLGETSSNYFYKVDLYNNNDIRIKANNAQDFKYRPLMCAPVNSSGDYEYWKYDNYNGTSKYIPSQATAAKEITIYYTKSNNSAGTISDYAFKLLDNNADGSEFTYASGTKAGIWIKDAKPNANITIGFNYGANISFNVSTTRIAARTTIGGTTNSDSTFVYSGYYNGDTDNIYYGGNKNGIPSAISGYLITANDGAGSAGNMYTFNTTIPLFASTNISSTTSSRQQINLNSLQTLAVSPFGGSSSNYTYTWKKGADTLILTGTSILVSNDYEYKSTDSNEIDYSCIVSDGVTTYTAYFYLTFEQFSPLSIDVSSQVIDVYKHPFDATYGINARVIASNGKSTAYSYVWSNAATGSSSKLVYKTGISSENITVTVSDSGKSPSQTKTFIVSYIDTTLVNNVIPSSVAAGVVQKLADNTIVTNAASGLGKVTGNIVNLDTFTAPTNPNIAVITGKINEITTSVYTQISISINKYDSAGSKIDSTLSDSTTYGTTQFNVPTDKSFQLVWNGGGKIAYYDVSLNTVKYYNGDVLQSTSVYGSPSKLSLTNNGIVSGRRSFTYFGPNSTLNVLILNNTSALPCFVAGTRIMTPTGEKLVEDLRSGDIILSADGRKLPATIYSTKIAKTTNQTAPYLIPANAFSKSYPPQDIILSPKHAIQSRKGVWEIPQFAEGRYPAVQKTKVGEAVEYFHIELPNFFTDNVIANGSVCESLGSKAQSQLKGKALYTFNKKLNGFTRYNPTESIKLTK